MTQPPIHNLTKTAHELHRAALLLGAVQRLTQPPRPAYLELGLEVLPGGLATGMLPRGGRVLLDLAEACLAYAAPGNRRISFPLQGRSQADLFADLFGSLATGE